MQVLIRPSTAFAFRLSSRAITSSAMLRTAHGDSWYGIEQAAGREIVGHGLHGQPVYFDRVNHPYPAIRFRKEDDTIRQLRAKEKGDWRKLTMEEKKALYRSSFAMTFAEVYAPNGHWKLVTGMTLLVVSATLWYAVFLNRCCFLPVPDYYSEEAKERIMQTHIDLFAEPYTGYSSKWDYENNRWKA